MAEIWRLRYTLRDGSLTKKLAGLGKSFELVINGLTPPYTLKTRKQQELKFWCIGLCVCACSYSKKRLFLQSMTFVMDPDAETQSIKS